MPTFKNFRALALLAAAAAVACGSEPPALDVQAATSTDNTMPSAATADGATGPAGGLATDAALPPGHPPIPDGAGAAAPSGMPPGHPPTAGFEVPPAPPGTGEGATALAWETPAGWTAETPASGMRKAQYRIPGAAGDAECVVFYFGPGQGGPPLDNARRWAAQFVDDAGKPLVEAMKTRSEKIGATNVLFVENAGTYLAGSMTGSADVQAMKDFALMGAIAEGPDANWFFKLTGPQATVEAQRGAFEKMIRSLERGA